MIWFLIAAVGFVMYGICRAAAAHARRVERDQAEIAGYRSYADLGDPLKRKGGRP